MLEYVILYRTKTETRLIKKIYRDKCIKHADTLTFEDTTKYDSAKKFKTEKSARACANRLYKSGWVTNFHVVGFVRQKLKREN